VLRRLFLTLLYGKCCGVFSQRCGVSHLLCCSVLQHKKKVKGAPRAQ
jgi:hypothetical protein